MHTHIFFSDLKTLIEHLASADIVASSNRSVGLSLRNDNFFLLSACMEELSSTLKITTFSPHRPYDKENYERASNPIPYPLYPYLFGSAFLANFTAPNK